MTPKRFVVALAVAGAVLGSAAPALAQDDGSKVCVVATHDRNNPGPSALCVWVPVASPAR